MVIGWVVATLAGETVAGIMPVGWGGLTGRVELGVGGFWTLGGVEGGELGGGVLPTGAATSGCFSFFLPNENEKGIGKDG
jgi:hypothetical protein